MLSVISGTVTSMELVCKQMKELRLSCKDKPQIMETRTRRITSVSVLNMAEGSERTSGERLLFTARQLKRDYTMQSATSVTVTSVEWVSRRMKPLRSTCISKL
jgi:hypothetical protein